MTVHEEHSAECTALVGAIAWEIPAFTPVLQAHLDELDSLILPHVLMSDYERHVEAIWQTDPESVQALLAFLEIAAAADTQTVRELIEISFVGMLPYPGEPHDGLRDTLGPLLSTLLRHGI